MSRNNEQGSDKQDKERKGRGTAEVAVLAISTGVVLFLIGYAIYHAAVATDTLPRLTADPLISQVREQDGKYLLPVMIRNATRPTVQDVHVIVRVTSPRGGPTEQKEIIIRYLPENSHVKGYVILDRPPKTTRMQVEVQSVRIP